MASLFRECHVFAMPSKKEGFGIVYVEAMLAGMPCIGANHGGTPEVIEHCESGFLIEYHDVSQFVFYLGCLVEIPGLYESMSAKARVRAEYFSYQTLEKTWNNYLDRFADDGSVSQRSTSPASVEGHQ